MDNKLTDNDIIKALEYCATREISNGIAHKVLDLINRRNAEIERLQKALKVQDIMIGNQPLKLQNARNGAINAYYDKVKTRCIKGGIFPSFVNRQMENLRDEMLGG